MEKKKFNWAPALFIIIYQTILIISMPFAFYYTPPGWTMFAVSFVLLYLTGLSITAGYHRLFAHRAYKTNSVIEAIVLFFGTMAAQGSALRWGFDHRLHHANVDTDEDPYSIKKGFWYAHCLWILEKPRTIDPKVVPDLLKNKLIQFQHRFYPIWMVLTNAIVTVFVGWLMNDYWGAFYYSCWMRIFTLHHFTWFINSLAHTWGDKPFCQEQTAVNNFVISLLTFGEGYHNFHHTYANDYRNGIRWYHFDPTKWLIWTLNKLGMTHSLKQMDPITIRKRMVLERKQLLLDKMRDLWYVRRDELEKKISELSDRLMVQYAEFNDLCERYNVARKAREQEMLKELRLEIGKLKRNLKNDWREWVLLSRNILKMRPLKA